jgi:nicotinate-nucleotide pyrophosphorylase (carboxylating)
MIGRLDRGAYADLVRRALEEDVRDGDVTSAATVPAAARAQGLFLAKQDCVVAGLDVALEAFRQLESGVAITIRAADGERCAAGAAIATVAGSARALLAGERTALNFLQRLSGIATLTRRFVDAAGGRITILDTRKTTPTLRELEKYAVRAGGGSNHRLGLYDAILIKDNHIRLAGGIAGAIRQARGHAPGLPIEVEAETLAQAGDAVEAGADIILLDNMALETIRAAVQRVSGRAKTEISGGVTLDRIGDLASTGADFVSVGALTHSAPAIDISFEIESV